MESLIDARPQIIIDLGDAKDTIADDMRFRRSPHRTGWF